VVQMCNVYLTLVSGQGALVAVESIRRKRSQYSSHALSADRYWVLVPSGSVSCQNCLQNRCCNSPGEPRRTAG
jgi:hypothetical protein